MMDTPEKMWEPRAHEVFVFGSNLAGRHGKGAALFAWHKCGAVHGKGMGYSCRSYAIPTKDRNLSTLPLSSIETYIDEFLRFAEQQTHLTFWLSKIGCGLAGYSHAQIAGLLVGKLIPSNVRLPATWPNTSP